MSRPFGRRHRVLEGKNGVQDVYDEMADRYDTSKRLHWTRRIEEGEWRVIGRWLGDLRTPVLEVGCGTGRYAGKIAESNRTVIALDISLRMLRKAKDRLGKDIGAGRIHAVQGDGENIPLRNDSVSGLICTLTFDHFEDCELGASEFSRVLKPGGLCILSTFNSRTLSDVQGRLGLPSDKISFETEDMPPTLVHEAAHSVDEVKTLFAGNDLCLLDVKGCCHRHLLPPLLMGRHADRLDVPLNRFKVFLTYADIHVTYMRKKRGPKIDQSKLASILID